MIGIIGAMEEEVAILKDEIQGLTTEKIAHVEVYKGTLFGKEVVLMQSGIGKVNAAICTTLLISNFKPDYIINTGSAGGLGSGLKVGDILVSTEVLHHDVDATEFGYTEGQVPMMPASYPADDMLVDKTTSAINKHAYTAHTGLIVSGDSFIGSAEKKAVILEKFPHAMAVEMEAAAVAQTCYQFSTPFIITRAVSDLANGEAEMSFEQFLKVACVSSSNIVKSLLETL
ncbi:5'-methylthioadenosine/adenosylhomocysteine nucleosidase [Macrococcoides canis]|uniref:5'-methylthioadenosine/S-adenosylhomocysteine nucleosidase n=1 Tax=Macrococcoides canis TaxID=1855823 RepID=A0AAE6X319_9STAP|nr:5'-methylthioadenosine/adenosylhomocysteine nucleosidase [Macrococcus canis]QIH76177.1 5'-methylthioadenosine/adenosylhomocysteine nucleosidase [Macrococcus canis]QIH78652.1 5'-methylthioadenosine/adenosylhomocysteine nucleosidase [Macrococcus canis]QNR08159.1 5'-methylthioadenosine/adenosylhomocysteine nucleosidase [Macrococcus canis]QTQ07290.1 5'-methylthioadenosine/adenosylhomocysteine nucleosidase [Macrococcus canis]UTH01545.1 5'-methylthioadenosine/adenosylhomocysteine nucleosidase [Ma